MESLDANALFNIAKDMDLVDILSLCQSSKQMKKICDSRFLWRYLLQRDYGVDKFNWKPDIFFESSNNPEKKLYNLLYNNGGKYYGILIEKDSDEIVEINIYRSFYTINTAHGEVLKYITLTDTYNKLTDIIIFDDEPRLITFDEAWGGDKGIQQVVETSHGLDLLPDIINTLTELEYAITSIDYTP